MPTKYKPSEVKIDRQTKTKSIQHYYTKQLSQEELFKMLNAENTKPKLKQKIRNELSRRGVRIVKSNKQAGVC
tara:strand:+ start:2499 stop:2717 length:219 start_codon:yes stop_codon:yes gene_type:complete